MRHRVLFVLVLCLAAVAMLGIGASAAAADSVWPGVGTAHIAHFEPDGHWWTGGSGWGDSTAFPAGTPIPAGDSVVIYASAELPVKADLEGMPQGLLISVTVTGPDGSVILATTEAQSPQFWLPIKWEPFGNAWFHAWEVYVGPLPTGTYQVAFALHQLETVVVTEYDDNGNLVPVVEKAFKKTFRSSFIMQ